jgi:hypothetical protein
VCSNSNISGAIAAFMFIKYNEIAVDGLKSLATS